MLTKKRLMEVLEYDPETGLFTWRVRLSCRAMPGRVATNKGPQGYVFIAVDKKRYLAHRLAWFYMRGRWPRGTLDHINRVRDDNRIANLRLATQSQQGHNSGVRRDNTSGFRGVYYNNRKQKRVRRWHARLYVEGKCIDLGYYMTREEAAAAYEAARNRYIV